MKQFIILIFTLLFVSNQALAQLPDNLSQYKAGMISDEQLKKYLEQAKSKGLTLEMAELELKKRGLPDAEMAILRTRIQQLGGINQSISNAEVKPNVIDAQETRNRTDKLILPDDASKKAQNDDIAKVFGYELFNGHTMTFEPNLRIPTPSNYKLGPDDQLLLDISGVNESQQSLTVTPEGFIRVKYAGPIYVTGLTVDEAKLRIYNKVSKIYPNLKSGGSKLALSLGAIRSIKVSIIGAVTKPGTYTISSLATLFNALYQSGGPNDYGSFREIELIRNNKVVETVDVYRFLLNGDLSQNVRLMDNDVIRIPMAKLRVNVQGSVKRTGIFELLSGDNLETVLNHLCGGFQRSAYKAMVKVERITDKQKRLIDVNKSQYQNFIPEDGDSYLVGKILDRFENAVTINGAVLRPGKFSLEPEMRISDLIEKAEGFADSAYIYKAMLYRIRSDRSPELVFVDLSKLHDSANNLRLRKDDELVVKDIFEFRDEFMVRIEGGVRRPGEFPYRDSMRILDLIFMSGGLVEDVFLGRAILTRTLANGKKEVIDISLDSLLKDNRKNLIIQKRDVLTINTNAGLGFKKQISIFGEIKNPGTFDFSKNITLKSLIFLAGGFTEIASELNVEIARKKDIVDPNDPKAPLSDVIAFTLDTLELTLGKKDFVLEPDDIVSIRSNPFKARHESMTLSGEVLFPGVYVVQNREERISSVIKRAGGLMSEANIEGARLRRFKRGQVINWEDVDKIGKQVKDSTGNLVQEAIKTIDEIAIDLREALRNPGGSQDFVILDGDELIIPRKDEMVNINGEVLHPVKIAYKPGRSLRYYIRSAGGFVSSANKNKTFVVYSNGRASNTRKSFFFFRNYPKVKPGCQVFVPKEAQDTRPKKSATEIMAISSAVATFAYLLIFITQQVK